MGNPVLDVGQVEDPVVEVVQLGVLRNLEPAEAGEMLHHVGQQQVRPG